jgi:ribosomal protein S18 acetylase RimI-like enzyme
MTVSLAPAATIDDERLAALFTAVYAGYWHPIQIDADGLRRMVATYDLELGDSVVALDGGELIGVAMLAVRGSEGWIGGMGVVPDRRGEGLGNVITQALLDNARAHGVRRVRLEVLEQNAPAIAIYRSLGFGALGDVAVWRLDTAPEAAKATDADIDDALSQLAGQGREAPWQRSAATIARSRQAGADLRAMRNGDGVAIYTATDAHAALQAIEAPSPDSAAALLRAPFDRGSTSLLFLNGAVDGPVAEALETAGATQLAVQHELAIDV